MFTIKITRFFPLLKAVNAQHGSEPGVCNLWFKSHVQLSAPALVALWMFRESIIVW